MTDGGAENRIFGCFSTGLLFIRGPKPRCELIPARSPLLLELASLDDRLADALIVAAARLGRTHASEAA